MNKHPLNENFLSISHRSVFATLLCLFLFACASANRPAILITAAGPDYPLEARISGIQGYVKLIYDVTVEGEVVNVRVLAANPVGVFDEAAVAALKRWRFSPAKTGDRPAASKNQVSTLTFELETANGYDRSR